MTWTEANRAAWELLEQGRMEAAVQEWAALALMLSEQGLWWEARGIGRTLVSVTRAAHWRLRSAAMSVMTEVCRSAGELAEASSWAGRSLALHGALGDVRAQAGSWVALGELAEQRGELLEASACWQRALALLDEESAAEAVHEVLLDLGRVHSELAQRELAAQYAEQAERVAARWAA